MSAPASTPPTSTPSLREIRANFDPRSDFLLLPRVPFDTLDFTSFRMHEGSKMAIDATPKRDREPSGPARPLDLDALGANGVAGARLREDCMLMVKTEGEGRPLAERLAADPRLSDVKVTAVVSADVDLDDPTSALWGIFTRFDPARDVVFPTMHMEGAAPVYEGPLVIDASWKPGYPRPAGSRPRHRGAARTPLGRVLVMSRPPKRQVVLITGATRGIGREAALQIARRGHTVMATGRDVERLDSLQKEADAAGLVIETSRLDVSDAAACEAWTSGTIERHGRIDALVNNAGYGLWGPWEHVSDDEVRTVFEANFIGPMRLSRLVIPGMREQGFGTIIHVGSMAGQASSPRRRGLCRHQVRHEYDEPQHAPRRGALRHPGCASRAGIFKTDFVPSQIMAGAMGPRDDSLRAAAA